MGEMTGDCRVLAERPEGKEPLGSPRRRLEDNIKVDLHKVGRDHGMDLSGSEQEQAACSCRRSNEHSVSTKCGEFFD
jgi:hypothetical protein